MRKGFTLLELMIVVIIVGVLATLGITQYQAAIEKARGAEARTTISQMRSTCAAIYLQGKDVTVCTSSSGSALGLGTTSDSIPTACRASNYFRYAVSNAGSVVTFSATRCTTGGKTPDAAAANSLTLATDYNAGTDSWSGPY